MNLNQNKIIKLVKIFSIPLTIILISFIFCHYCIINYTRSEPRGIYIKKNEHKINKNDYVVFSNNINLVSMIAVERKYIREKDSFIKNVFGTPGDIIKIDNNILKINNKTIGMIFSEDANKKPLISIIKEGIIPENHYFVGSTRIKNSFDSRYFGLVERNQIKFVVAPLITF